MAIKHIILAFLANNPASGYALNKAIFKPLRVKLPQIYRAISELYDEGLITQERIHHKTKPTENIYRVTKAGYKVLDKWLSEPVTVHAIDEPIMVIIWFGGTSLSLYKKEIVTKAIEAFIKKREYELNYYQTEAADIIEHSGKDKIPLERLYRELVVDYFGLRAKTDIQWAKLALKRIMNLP